MPSHFLLRHPRFVGLGIRIDMLPATWWLALQAAALWPAWAWAARRTLDGAGPAPGLLAFGTLALFCVLARGPLRAAPRLAWLLPAMAGTAIAAVAAALLPVFTVFAALPTLACALLAFVPSEASTRDRPRAAWLLPANTFLNRVLFKSAFGLALAACGAGSAAVLLAG